MTSASVSPSAAPAARLLVRCAGARRLLPAALVAVALAGCGSSSSASDQVRSAWNDLKSALVNGDGSKLCGLLTSTAQSQLVSEVRTLDPSVKDCQGAAKILLERAKAERSKLSSATLKTVSVHGNTATTSDSTGGTPNTWVKQGGSWKLSATSSS